MTRDELLDRLHALLPAQLEELVFRLAIPPHLLSGNDASPTLRAIEVIRYMTGAGRLDELVRHVAPPRAKTSGMVRLRVLFVSAEPSDEARRALDAQLSEIERGLAQTGAGQRCTLLRDQARQPADLRLLLLRYQPDVLHVSGEASLAGEIRFEAADGRIKGMPSSAWTTILTPFRDVPRCVVLAGCGSASHVDSIRREVACVVELGVATPSSSTIAFSLTFYQAIAQGRAIATAFEQGRAQLATRGAAAVAFLATRDGVDPSTVSLAERSGASSSSEPPAARIGRHGLPVRHRALVGRARELAELLAKVRHQNKPVVAIKGLAGVGKTALGLELAYAVKTDYPDAQFYFDLKGDGASPIPSKQIMEMVVSEFDSSRAAFLSEAFQRTLYLDTLHDRRVLIVLDNAADSSQIDPLLAGPRCLVVVTSRRHVGVVETAELRVLEVDDAVRLLRAMAPRLETEPGELLSELAVTCGCLPLALTAVGSALHKHKGLQVDHHLQRLKANQTDVLFATGPFDNEKSTASALRASCDLLDPELQRCFRFLGVFPGDFDVPAAAAVWKLPYDEAERIVSELEGYSLVGFDMEGRFRLHDLVRVFANVLLDERERSTSARRHAYHFLRRLEHAVRVGLDAEVQIRRDLLNIQAGQKWCVADGASRRSSARWVCCYAEAAHGYLESHGSLEDRIGWQRALQAAAQRLGDQDRWARAAVRLGWTFKNVGRYQDAAECHDEAVGIACRTGNAEVKSAALFALGCALHGLGDMESASYYLVKRRELAASRGERRDVASSIGVLGEVYYALGRYDLARDCALERLAFDEGTNPDGVMWALDSLGRAEVKLDNADAAWAHHERQMQLASQSGSSQAINAAFGGLGNAALASGDFARAIDIHERRIEDARKIGDQLGEARSELGISRALFQLGNVSEAIRRGGTALRLMEAIQSSEQAEARAELERFRAAERGEGSAAATGLDRSGDTKIT